MRTLFHSYFSRRVVLLYLGLALSFSLFIVVVPSAYTFYVQEQQIANRKQVINTKVQSIYLPQAISKAKSLEQILDGHEKDVLILADATSEISSPLKDTLASAGKNRPGQTAPENISDFLEQTAKSYNCSFFAPDGKEGQAAELDQLAWLAPITTTMQSIKRKDPTIQDVFIRSAGGGEWDCPGTANGAAHYAAYAFADRYYFPMTVAEWSIRWSAQFVDGIPIITVVAPIWSEGKLMGVAGINLQLAIVVNQVPQYNLASTSQMFVLDPEGVVLTAPSWVSASEFVPWVSKDISNYLNQPFTSLMAGVLGPALPGTHLEEKISETTPIIFSIDYHGARWYLAMAPVSDKAIKVLVVIPLEEVYNTLSFFGESFTTNIVPIMIEFGLTMLVIFLILTGGALLSIRYFSEPIQEVSKSALHLAAGDLSQRVPEKWGGELFELSRSFNKMAENVQISRSESISKEEQLLSLVEIQKGEFDIIRQVVALTNQVKELSRLLLDALEVVTPRFGATSGAVILLGAEHIQQIIIKKTDPEDDVNDEAFFKAVVSRELTYYSPAERAEFLVDTFILPGTLEVGPAQVLTLPILERDGWLGLLSFRFHTQDTLPPLRHPFLALLAKTMAVLVEQAQLRDKMRDLIINEERQHMANELHDAISQSLFSLSLTEESLRYQIENNGDVDAPLDFLIDQTQHIQEEMRWLINELRPISSSRDNLSLSLERQAQSLRRLCSTLTVELNISGEVAAIPFEMQMHLNRIAQEAISNILRHARAAHAWIRLTILAGAVEMEIRDDGVGFDLQRNLDGKAESYGIISMCGRADQIHAHIDILSTPGGGTHILVTAPLPLETGEASVL